jgi:hypothetical protein
MSGGKGAVVSLCAGSVHRLYSPVVYTAPRQTLTTEGNVKGRERAMLIVEGQDQAIAILYVGIGRADDRADCNDCSFATVQSLVIDGNRPQLLRVPLGGALVELGNGEGQTVRDCRLYEPRCVSRWLELMIGAGRHCISGKGISSNAKRAWWWITRLCAHLIASC